MTSARSHQTAVSTGDRWHFTGGDHKDRASMRWPSSSSLRVPGEDPTNPVCTYTEEERGLPLSLVASVFLSVQMYKCHVSGPDILGSCTRQLLL